MGAPTRRPTTTKQARSLPAWFSSHYHKFSRKIMRADEKRVVEKHLSCRRRVVGVVQSHQAVPQEGHEPAANHRQFFGGTRGFDTTRQIGRRLLVEVGVADVTRGPLHALP